MLTEQQVRLEAEDLVVDWLVHEGYDPAYGARPLKRALQVRRLTRFSLGGPHPTYHPVTYCRHRRMPRLSYL